MSRFPEHEILPVEQWIYDDGDGFGLRSPVGGQPMDPNQPPSFLLDHNIRLQDGKGYLEYMGSTTLGLYYTTGENHVSQLGGAQFDNLVLDPRYNTQAVGHTVDGVVRLENNDTVLLRNRTNTYTDRIHSIAEPANIATFCVGLEVTPAGEPATRTERALWTIRNIAENVRPRYANDGLPEAAQIIARDAEQWYRVFGTGEQAQHIWATHLGGLVALENLLVAAPIEDAGYTRKFETFNLAQVAEEAVDPDSYTSDMQVDTHIMSLGRIPRDYNR